MFANILMIIVVMGANSCVLLVNRQQRIDTTHDTARLHQEILRQQQRCWELRRDIAVESQPDRIRAALGEISGQWLPIIMPTPTTL